MVTAASEFPDDAVEEDLEEEEAKSARAKLLSMKKIILGFLLIFCVLGKLFQIYRIIGFCFVWPLGRTTTFA